MQIVIDPKDHELFDDLLKEIDDFNIDGQEYGEIQEINEHNVSFKVGAKVSGRMKNIKFSKCEAKAASIPVQLSPECIEFLISFGTGVASSLAAVFILSILKKFKNRMKIMSINKEEVLKEKEKAPLEQDQTSMIIDELMKEEYFCKLYLQNEIESLKNEVKELKQEKENRNLLRERSRHRIEVINEELQFNMDILITLMGALNGDLKETISLSKNYIEIVLMPKDYTLFPEIINDVDIAFGEGKLKIDKLDNPNGGEMFRFFKVGEDVEGAIEGGGSINSGVEQIPNVINIKLQIKPGKNYYKIAEWTNDAIEKYIKKSSILSIELEANYVDNNIPPMHLQWLRRQIRDTQINIYRLVEERLFAELHIDNKKSVVGLESYEKELKNIDYKLLSIIRSELD